MITLKRSRHYCSSLMSEATVVWFRTIWSSPFTEDRHQGSRIRVLIFFLSGMTRNQLPERIDTRDERSLFTRNS